jgi:hypothetical protein
MNPETALGILEQALVSKQGLTLKDMSILLQAWGVLVNLVTVKPAPEPEIDA